MIFINYCNNLSFSDKKSVLYFLDSDDGDRYHYRVTNFDLERVKRMTEENTMKQGDNDFGLGTGYEPLAVCLMILFIWAFAVAFGSRFFA